MLQAVRWAGFVGGMLLLGLMLALWIRREGEPPRSAVLAAPGDLPSHYMVVLPNGTIHILEMSGMGGLFLDWSDREQIFYVAQQVTYDQYTLTEVSAYPFSLRQRDLDAIYMSASWGAISSFRWSPNRQWMVYLKADEAGVHLVRRDRNGENPLTMTLSGAFMPPYYPALTISPDGQWVYFNALTPNNTYMIARAPLVGGPIEDVTPIQADYIWLEFAQPDSAWVVLSGSLRGEYIHWRMRWDGSEFQPLATHAETGDIIVGYLLEQQLIIIYSNEKTNLSGVRLTDGAILWQLEDRGLVNQTPDEEWVVIQSLLEDRGQFYRMRWDGTEMTPLVYVGEYGGAWGWTPDGEWLIYMPISNSGGPFELRRVSADGKIDELLRSFPINIMINGFAADQQWMVLYTSESSQSQMTLYRIRPDGSGFSRLFQDKTISGARFVGYGPPIDLNWQPAYLIFGGVVLLAVNLGLGWRRRKIARRDSQ